MCSWCPVAAPGICAAGDMACVCAGVFTCWDTEISNTPQYDCLVGVGTDNTTWFGFGCGAIIPTA